MDNDNLQTIPSNISTVVDLLDSKGISWAEYEEDMPYAGYQGMAYKNQRTGANDYVRKHNPLIQYDSVTQNQTRLALIKNFTSFHKDIQAKTLPQWAFITPNMSDDGHDTNVTFASTWERNFLAPLLKNADFMNGTLLLLTFDESETYTKPNTMFTILIGGPGVIPDNLKGTVDNTFYNHYSAISTVSANWGLPSLGRWDCGANIFSFVAEKVGYKNAIVDTTNILFSSSYPGPLSSSNYQAGWAAPVTDAKCSAGKGVLQSVVNTWGHLPPTYNYTNPYPYDEASGTNV